MEDLYPWLSKSYSGGQNLKTQPISIPSTRGDFDPRIALLRRDPELSRYGIRSVSVQPLEEGDHVGPNTDQGKRPDRQNPLSVNGVSCPVRGNMKTILRTKFNLHIARTRGQYYEIE